MKRLMTLAALIGIWMSNASLAGDWPMFRGPNINGVATESSAPIMWSADENVRWKAELPGAGNGSPIVSNGKVFLTAAEDDEGRQRSLLCFDEESGESLWKRTVTIDRAMPTHKTNPHAPTTPASDGKLVVVWHGSAGLHCYDHVGNATWSRDLGEFRHMWGFGTSPILFDDLVILHSGPGRQVFVAAFDLKTGELRWRQDEPQSGTGERNAAGEYMGSWSTPVLATHGETTHLIVIHSTRVVAYEPESGEILWYCEGVGHDRGDLAYSSPVIDNGLCFVTGGFRGPAMAIRLGGSGNVTETHRLWRNDRQPQNIGSGVVIEGHVLRPNAGPGTIECIDIETGEIVWQDRAIGSMWSSLVKVGDLVYANNQDAVTTVFEASPLEFKEVSRNKLPGSSNSTPAVANGRIFIRTTEGLWCIGE
ncbi:PQQ-like beta-propeller repeat protein [Rubinisphaera margarita]|uniref:PQQ-like beta-propeller repeat protein n=1 Tax=Rubinisphaera margarita TaxID=2909586 RepID=UPI001EE8C0E6|nr:PQQ-like beta-propeller repeat protein [Rubinisphaera margarita]MCG6156575.1 PQQ-like beta-propeller repeat protein [Rubinisphaera margarita]